MVMNSYQVIDTYTYKNTTRYRVKCLLCGNTYVVTKSEISKPCSCIKPDDVVGQTFGNLFVFAVYFKDGQKHCKCICQLCGNLTDVFSTNLIWGHTKSCGCLKSKDLTGMKFGQLTVGPKVRKDNHTYYYCLCGVCGNTVLKRADTISSATSCGCDHKEERANALRDKAYVAGTQPSKIKLNKPPSKVNKSGTTGVNWDKSRGKWQASIKFKGKKYNLGRFDNIQDAIDARHEAEQSIFGDFINWYSTIHSKEET